MKVLSFAKGALAMFWLVALLNVGFPFADPLGSWCNWLALILLAVHLLEVLLFQRRIQERPMPWLGRLMVLLFGVLHIQSLPKEKL